MAGKIWEFFGYRSDDHSPAAVAAATDKQCPYLSEVCEKRLSDGAIAGVCTIKPATSGPVICCPIRLYADKYRALYDVAKIAFDDDLELIAGRQASARARAKQAPVVAVFGKRWGARDFGVRPTVSRRQNRGTACISITISAWYGIDRTPNSFRSSSIASTEFVGDFGDGVRRAARICAI